MPRIGIGIGVALTIPPSLGIALGKGGSGMPVLPALTARDGTAFTARDGSPFTTRST